MIIQFATLATLLAGIIFGFLEIRRASKARAEKAAIDVFSITVQDVVNDAHILVLDLPPDVSPDHIRNSPNTRRATELLMTLYDYWGILTFYRVVPLRTLDLLVGGVVRGSWMRLHKYIESEMETLGMPRVRRVVPMACRAIGAMPAARKTGWRPHRVLQLEAMTPPVAGSPGSDSRWP